MTRSESLTKPLTSQSFSTFICDSSAGAAAAASILSASGASRVAAERTAGEEAVREGANAREGVASVARKRAENFILCILVCGVVLYIEKKFRVCVGPQPVVLFRRVVGVNGEGGVCD